ncbi:MAG: hypothetical protein NTX22_10165 [Ignavibacteriales bacterium]|nr:hypothetical protein [Ignavibacteriales bacterium]
MYLFPQRSNIAITNEVGSQGRLVRTLLNNQASGWQGSVIFDGLNDSGNPLRIGIYIIFLEALNENSGVLETMKTVVVVARKL